MNEAINACLAYLSPIRGLAAGQLCNVGRSAIGNGRGVDTFAPWPWKGVIGVKCRDFHLGRRCRGCGSTGGWSCAHEACIATLSCISNLTTLQHCRKGSAADWCRRSHSADANTIDPWQSVIGIIHGTRRTRRWWVVQLAQTILGCLSSIGLQAALQFRRVTGRVARGDEVTHASFPSQRVIGMISRGSVTGLLEVAAALGIMSIMGMICVSCDNSASSSGGEGSK